MDISLQYLLKFPPWIAIPIAVITLLLTLWPKIYQLVTDIDASNRAYQSEKRRLEILKLRYEIEVIKRNNGIDSLANENHISMDKSSAIDVGRNKEGGNRLNIKAILMRFLCGTSGAFTPSVIKWTIPLLVTPETSFPFSALVKIFLLAVLGGIGTIFLPKHVSDPRLLFMVGLSIALVMLPYMLVIMN